MSEEFLEDRINEEEVLKILKEATNNLFNKEVGKEELSFRQGYQVAVQTFAFKFKEKNKEIERLNKELEYSDFCNKQLRDTITNLEYKVQRLEEDLKELKVKKKIGGVVSLEELESYLPQNEYEAMEQDLLFKD